MTDRTTRSTVLTPEQVAALPTTPLGNIVGVTNTVLWTDGVSTTGLLTVDAGHRLGRHRHAQHIHHMWVLDGAAIIADQRLAAGSYVNIPIGVDHDIDATDTDGVSMHYSYVRQTPAE